MWLSRHDRFAAIDKLRFFPKSTLATARVDVELAWSTPFDGPSPFLRGQRVVMTYDSAFGFKRRKKIYIEENPSMDDEPYDTANLVCAHVRKHLETLH